MIYNKCSSYCKPRNTDPRYKKIIDHVRKTNVLPITSISIAGEGTKGCYSVNAILIYLRTHIVNDTYHPYIFHYMIGVSIGAIAIVLVLNIRFLYEMHSKEKALEYLDALLEAFTFDNCREIFFDVGQDMFGNNIAIGDLMSGWKIFGNLIDFGSLCVRDMTIKFLQGNNPRLKFNNKRQYFTTKEYRDWLDSGELNNIFLLCYSGKQTKSIVFTGNSHRFLESVNTIEYTRLSSDNLIHAILCSSAIPLLFPVTEISGREPAIDGAASEVNPFVFLQIMINTSYFISSNLIYTPELNFFGIDPKTNNNFTIIHTKSNIQFRYQDLETFKQSSIPLLTSLSALMSLDDRIEYNAKANVSLSGLFLNQPFCPEFSMNNINRVISDACKNKSKLIDDNIHRLRKVTYKTRIPTFLYSKKQFDCGLFHLGYTDYNEYVKAYNKYNPIVSNLVVSTMLYALNPPEEIVMLDNKFEERTCENGEKIKLNLNICFFDQFIRTPNNVGVEELNVDMLLKNDTGFWDKNSKIGIVTGNMMYDTWLKQSLYTMDTDQVTCSCVKPHIQSLPKLIDRLYKRFLGPHQS